jgi:hypothetical protein
MRLLRRQVKARQTSEAKFGLCYKCSPNPIDACVTQREDSEPSRTSPSPFAQRHLDTLQDYVVDFDACVKRHLS